MLTGVLASLYCSVCDPVLGDAGKLVGKPLCVVCLCFVGGDCYLALCCSVLLFPVVLCCCVVLCCAVVL